MNLPLFPLSVLLSRSLVEKTFCPAGFLERENSFISLSSAYVFDPSPPLLCPARFFPFSPSGKKVLLSRFRSPSVFFSF